MLLMGEGRPMLLEMLGLLEEKLAALTAQIAGLPGDVMLAPDNLDGQYISPRVFRDQMAESYRRTAEAAHAQGKRLVVHAGGPVRRLLPLLAAAGVDVVEGVAPPPQSDATLAEARAAAGPDLILWGGIPQDLLLAEHDEAEFEAAVKDAATQAAQDGRMIVGIADRVPVNADIAGCRPCRASSPRLPAKIIVVRRPSSVVVPHRFRPYVSWLDTQSEDEIAAASEISPANATPAMISASLYTLSLPQQPNNSRHSRCVARPVPPP